MDEYHEPDLKQQLLKLPKRKREGVGHDKRHTGGQNKLLSTRETIAMLKASSHNERITNERSLQGGGGISTLGDSHT